MADEAVVLITIDSSDLYKTGHMANRWFSTVSRRFGRNVKRSAPHRDGGLRGGLSTKMTRRAKVMTSTTTSRAPYTMAVLRGTTTPTKKMPNASPTVNQHGHVQWISSTTPKKPMKVRGPGPSPQFFVAGQAANNFIEKGWRKTAAQHRVMRDVPQFVKHP